MNRLARQSSPYLLQHAANPVDWYPWGPEALDLARRDNKPIFLSIGYSACHWCHVMEHESFENPQIAAQLNEHFVNIKVDREERPDLDQIYMSAVQMMTGRGGWPMSVFLTPDLKPFFGGTYWPPSSRMGMPGFDQVIAAIAQAWQSRPQEVAEQAERLTEYLRQLDHARPSRRPLSPEILVAAETALARVFDRQYGGFGSAPKFPHPMDLQVLLRLWHRTGRAAPLEMATLTLDKMAAGGIYDHLGGGFHRYSVDARWLVPHFEKMLYDNALLAACYVAAWQATGRPDYARVARQTLDYVLREMTDPAGGFYSTQDADSEGHEGLFYVWTPDEIERLLGQPAARTFCQVYDVSDEGNFEGRNILNLSRSLPQSAAVLGRDPGELAAELAAARQTLLEARALRVWPGRDDKVIVSWNGLMIDALARAGAALGEPGYVEAAARAADFLLVALGRQDGRLLHSWRAGQTRLAAYLDDYACLADGLVSLYEATFQPRWIDAAVELADAMLRHFADPSGRGFFYTADDHETLITRAKDSQDSSVPSGNAMAATLLVRLGRLCGRRDYLEAAHNTLTAFGDLLEHAPTAAGQMLLALDMLLGPTHEVVLAGPGDDQTAALLDLVRRRYWPRKVLAGPSPQGGSPALAGLLDGKGPCDDQPTLYLCQDFTCSQPVVGRQAILAALDQLCPPS